MDDRSPRIAIFNPRSSIRLKNAPFILREPQDERRSGRNYWSFSVHAEPVEAFRGVFQRNLFRLPKSCLSPFRKLDSGSPPLSRGLPGMTIELCDELLR